jgi:hypothetical protein
MKPNFDSIEKDEPIIKGVKITMFSTKIRLNKLFKMKKTITMLLMLTIVVGAMAQGAEPVEVAKKVDFKLIIQWLSENWGWIAAALLAVSEGLAGSKLKAVYFSS